MLGPSTGPFEQACRTYSAIPVKEDFDSGACSSFIVFNDVEEHPEDYYRTER